MKVEKRRRGVLGPHHRTHTTIYAQFVGCRCTGGSATLIFVGKSVSVSQWLPSPTQCLQAAGCDVIPTFLSPSLHV